MFQRYEAESSINPSRMQCLKKKRMTCLGRNAEQEEGTVLEIQIDSNVEQTRTMNKEQWWC